MHEPWDLPDGWRWSRFDEVARVASNLVDPADFGAWPHIAPNHIQSETGKLLPFSTVAADGVTSPKHRFRTGQVLYSKIRPYLAKVIVADFEGLCSADMYPVDTELDPRFLKWWMLTGEFTRLAAGQQARTVLPKINARALNALPVPVPPQEEQRRIVDLLEDHLSRLDAGDALLRAAEGRARAADRAFLDTFTETSAAHVRLSELVERVEAGKSFGVAARPAAADEWGIVKVSAMTWGEFRADENKVVTDGAKVDPRYEIQAGDLLVSRANTTAYVGASVLVGDTRPRLLLSDKSLRLVPKEGVRADYLHTVLQAPRSRSQISALATGTKDSMRNISQAALLSIRVPSGDASHQAVVVERLAETQRATAQLREELVTARRRAQNLRGSLLGAAFSGRLLAPSRDLELSHV